MHRKRKEKNKIMFCGAERDGWYWIPVIWEYFHPSYADQMFFSTLFKYFVDCESDANASKMTLYWKTLDHQLKSTPTSKSESVRCFGEILGSSEDRFNKKMCRTFLRQEKVFIASRTVLHHTRNYTALKQRLLNYPIRRWVVQKSYKTSVRQIRLLFQMI